MKNNVVVATLRSPNQDKKQKEDKYPRDGPSNEPSWLPERAQGRRPCLTTKSNKLGNLQFYGVEYHAAVATLTWDIHSDLENTPKLPSDIWTGEYASSGPPWRECAAPVELLLVVPVLPVVVVASCWCSDSLKKEYPSPTSPSDNGN